MVRQVFFSFVGWLRQSATIPRQVFGGGSIQLARIYGIRIGVDASWFLVLFLIIWFLADDYGNAFPGEEAKSYALAVATALLFFVSLLLHELGHAVVAMRNGIGIAGIDLWLLGGVAKMERDTDSPGVEFRVAAAGPLVTLVIALACLGGGSLIAGFDETLDAALFDPSNDSEVLAVLGYLGFINVLLLLFNLIPAFPLDGGRIARAVAWKFTGRRASATRFAATLGRGLSMLMIAAGIFLAAQGALFSGIWLGFIGYMLFQSARAAVVQTVFTSRIEGLRVADVMDSEPVSISGNLPLERAYDEHFLRYGYPWFPVVDEERRLVGLVRRESIEAVPEAERGTRTVASVMAGDPGSGIRVGADEPLEALLGRDGLTRLGAMMAVDRDGRLRGIVTADQVRAALSPPTPA